MLSLDKLAKTLLVMPATNAAIEILFSALKRTKAYLRSASNDKRINHLMLLHIGQQCYDCGRR